jgi:hypothetical protein
VVALVVHFLLQSGKASRRLELSRVHPISISAEEEQGEGEGCIAVMGDASETAHVREEGRGNLAAAAAALPPPSPLPIFVDPLNPFPIQPPIIEWEENDEFDPDDPRNHYLFQTGGSGDENRDSAPLSDRNHHLFQTGGRWCTIPILITSRDWSTQTITGTSEKSSYHLSVHSLYCSCHCHCYYQMLFQRERSRIADRLTGTRLHIILSLIIRRAVHT